MDVVEQMRAWLNPQLQVAGVILTRFDSRLRIARDVEELLRDRYGDLVLATVARQTMRMPETPSRHPAAEGRPSGERVTLRVRAC